MQQLVLVVGLVAFHAYGCRDVTHVQCMLQFQLVSNESHESIVAHILLKDCRRRWHNEIFDLLCAQSKVEDRIVYFPVLSYRCTKCKTSGLCNCYISGVVHCVYRIKRCDEIFDSVSFFNVLQGTKKLGLLLLGAEYVSVEWDVLLHL